MSNRRVLPLALLAVAMLGPATGDLTAQDAGAAASAPAAPRRISVPAGGNWHSMGSDKAPLTLLEFTDYECPLCRAFHVDTFRRLKTRYIDTGHVRFVSRDQPMSDYHPRAMDAAHAGRCAGEQGKFWEMRDLLIVHGERLAGSATLEYARQARLDEPAFRSCLSARKYQREIDQDIADAIALKLRGTPQFVLGRMSGQTLDGIVIVGAQPYEVFERAIDGMLTAPPR